MLPPEAIEEFKQIYLEEFGSSLTDEQAVKQANGFMDLFKILVCKKHPIAKREKGANNENC